MFTKEDGKLVEKVEQPAIEKRYSKEEVDKMLQASIERRDIKILELAGAEQEVLRIQEMKDKCEELGVEPDSAQEVKTSYFSIK